ncbi:Anaerobic magnesium-protoporphyrin IX monomethyl ester cyclase [Thermoflexales bacterium]|nr:Anaerobic magnesium-protoporphyrin IX monomethyl ester cyclase [Thermoflexales bacterium]
MKNIFLVKPPFFSPLTPPLSLAVLKASLERQGHKVLCYDFNVDPELWGIHHKYFKALCQLDEITINDGYSKLWYVLNAHLLAVLNGCDRPTCTHVLEAIMPLYGISPSRKVIQELTAISERFFQRLVEIIDSFDLSSFSVVGTSTYSTSLAASLFFLLRVKQRSPHLMTVMGGGIFADDLALGSDNLEILLKEYPFIDHVIVGEGELLFHKVLQGDFRDKRLISIADIAGQTLAMSEVPIPDFSDFDLENYYHLSIEGGRSCPFECSFCSETIQWGSYRKKPKHLLAAQMQELTQKYNNNTYFMGDSLMNPYIMDLSTDLLDQGSHILYDGYLRADKIATNRAWVKMWAQSGMQRARLGIESGSAHVLNLMSKKTSPETITEVLRTLSNAGIRTTTYWIVGFPNETEEDFQETLAFIRKNHRYIYELEAHPYYYYPYGQIDSRFHNCESLYPDHVTRAIKFKWWEVIGVQPTRQVRYDRLRRISNLAAEMGLPNIYTMAERYQAEERWQRLHPLAIEVYQGTITWRQATRALDHLTLESIPKWLRPQLTDTLTSNLILGYHITNTVQVDEAILSSAIECLIRFNEALQIGWIRNPPSDNCAASLTKALAIYSLVDNDPQDFHDSRRRIVKELIATIQQRSNPCFYFALIQRSHGRSELLLVIDSAIADGRSVVLLLEDLFRIYEQLAAGREITLRPVVKPYTDFLREWAFIDDSAPPSIDTLKVNLEPNQQLLDRSPQVAHIRIGTDLYQRMFSQVVTEYDLTPMEIMISAILKSIGDPLLQVPLPTYIRLDYRCLNANFKYTTGQMMVLYCFPVREVAEGDVRQLLRQLFTEGAPLTALPHSTKKDALLLNFDYLCEEPWLGGDTWAPQGFLFDGQERQHEYGFEIIPVVSGQDIIVQVHYMNDPSMQKLVDRLIGRLVDEIGLILDHCENYIAAKHFWTKEFKQITSIVQHVQREPSKSEPLTMSCEIDPLTCNALRAMDNIRLSAVTLAAYSILLSQANDQEDVSIFLTFEGLDGLAQGLFRISPYPTLRPKEFLYQLEQKVALTLKHSVYLNEFLFEWFLLLTRGGFEPNFEAAYVFRKQPIEHALATNTKPAKAGLNFTADLVLEVQQNTIGLNMLIHYNVMRFQAHDIERLSSYLGTLLNKILEGQEGLIENISVNVVNQQDLSNRLLNEQFNF